MDPSELFLRHFDPFSDKVEQLPTFAQWVEKHSYTTPVKTRTLTLSFDTKTKYDLYDKELHKQSNDLLEDLKTSENYNQCLDNFGKRLTLNNLSIFDSLNSMIMANIDAVFSLSYDFSPYDVETTSNNIEKRFVSNAFNKTDIFNPLEKIPPVKSLTSDEPYFFLDINNENNGFSKYLSWRRPKSKGYTIAIGKNQDWEMENVKRVKFSSSERSKIIEEFLSVIYKEKKYFDLIVSSGIETTRDILSQVIIVLNLIKLNGSFVLKLDFDVTNILLTQIFQLLADSFNTITFFKPISTGHIDFDSYLVCNKFKGRTEYVTKYVLPILYKTLEFLETGDDKTFEPLEKGGYKSKISSIFKERIDEKFREFIYKSNNESFKREIRTYTKLYACVFPETEGSDTIKPFPYYHFNMAHKIWYLPEKPFVSHPDIILENRNEVKCAIVEKGKEDKVEEIQIDYMDKLFPPLKSTGKIPEGLKITNVGKFSVTPYRYNQNLIKLIKDIAGENASIVDALACNGGDTINFALNFRKVYSVELNETNFEVLVNNVSKYFQLGYSQKGVGFVIKGIPEGTNKVEMFIGDFLEFKDKQLKTRHIQPNVVYFDPPWGGPDYCKVKRLEMFIGKVNIKDIILELIEYIPVVILKAPYNFDRTGLNRYQMIKGSDAFNYIVFGKRVPKLDLSKYAPVEIKEVSKPIKDVKGFDIQYEDEVPRSKYAFVSLIMKDTSYINGLIALSNSLKQNYGLYHRFVVMCTPDLYKDEQFRTHLGYFCDEVVEVPYIEVPSKKMKTQKQRDIYETWISQSYTKWNALNLTKYEKVLFLDLDTIALKNINDLFDLEAPAATFSSAWASPYKEGSYDDIYMNIKHGQKISLDLAKKGLVNPSQKKGTFTLIGTSVLLKPSKESYTKFINFINGKSKAEPYGYTQCLSGFDEQSLCDFYTSMGVEFTQIHQSYNIIPWHEESWLKYSPPEFKEPFIYHYFNKKPWNLTEEERNMYIKDVRIWDDMFDDSCIIQLELLRSDLYYGVLTILYENVYKTCEVKGCNKIANFNYKGETKPIRCNEHKEDQMVKVEYKRNHKEDLKLKNNLSGMLLRYRFNLEEREEDDAVFVTNFNNYADEQWYKDCDTYGIVLDVNIVKEEFAKSVDKINMFRESMATVGSYIPDRQVMISSDNNGISFLEYDLKSTNGVSNIVLPDYSNLGLHNPQYAFAILYRYSYMNLGNQGLARLYGDEWEIKKEDGFEAFSSVFNHYYDNFCSLFPDLEYKFGSKGSFFEMESFDKQYVFVNPPFDEAVISRAIDKIIDMVDSGAENEFIFTIPYWDNFPALDKLRNYSYTIDEKIYKKGELAFKNYISGEIVYPVDIIELTVTR